MVEEYFPGREGQASGPAEGGHLILDFTARLVVNGTCAPEMPRLGNVLSCDERTTLDTWLPYRIPEEWQMTTDTRKWGELAERRRPKFVRTRACDAREVLYAKLPSVA